MLRPKLRIDRRLAERAMVPAIVLALVCGGNAAAEDNAGIGYQDLIDRIGEENVPTGLGIVVAQIEASDAQGNYQPDGNHAEFVGKTFIPMSGSAGSTAHATAVGRCFFGLTDSVVPGVETIHTYSAVGWALQNFLRTNPASSLPPLNMPGGIKVLNHSWVGTFGSTSNDNDALRRTDFVVNRDDVLIIVGVNNSGSSPPLLSHNFNGMSVGRENGAHVTNDTAPQYDGGGRMKPEIVAPGAFTSFATPVVASCAALLVDTAQTGLVGNPNADRAPVVKATLLAGAVHRPAWTNNPVPSGPDRGITDRPLDNVFGADTVNINRSHMILTAGEQDGETTPPAAPNASHVGWDLALVENGDSVWWRFDVPALADEASIVATWNRELVGPPFSNWFNADFDLILWRLDGAGGLETLVGDPGLPYFDSGNVVSDSAIDNIEHLYLRDLEPGEYALEARRLDIFTADWELAVAWFMPEPPVIPGDINGDGLVNVADMLILLTAWGECPKGGPCDADLDGNGSVGVPDFLILLSNWTF